jgi:hypothetical protein
MAKGTDGAGTEFDADQWVVSRILGVGERAIVLETRPVTSTGTPGAGGGRALKINREESLECVVGNEFGRAGLGPNIYACDRGPFMGKMAQFQWSDLIDSSLRQWIDSQVNPTRADILAMTAKALDLIDMASENNMTHGDLVWDNLATVQTPESDLPVVMMIDFEYSTTQFADPLLDHLQLLRTASYHRPGSVADRRWSWIRSFLVDRILQAEPWAQLSEFSGMPVTDRASGEKVLWKQGLYDDLWVQAFRAYLRRRRAAGETVSKSSWEDDLSMA